MALLGADGGKKNLNYREQFSPFGSLTSYLLSSYVSFKALFTFYSLKTVFPIKCFFDKYLGKISIKRTYCTNLSLKKTVLN